MFLVCLLGFVAFGAAPYGNASIGLVKIFCQSNFLICFVLAIGFDYEAAARVRVPVRVRVCAYVRVCVWTHTLT